MESTQIYCLASQCKESAFFADCPLSKSAVSRALSTSRSSIKRLEEIAYTRIDNFANDYPLYPKAEWISRKSKHNREAPLTPFQIWVLSLLQKSMKVLNNKNGVEGFIAANNYLFTKTTYTKELQKLSKITA